MQDLEHIPVWQKDASSFKLLPLSELEILLNFHYLPALVFKEEENIWEKGIQKWEEGKVVPDHLHNGLLYKRSIEKKKMPKASLRWCGENVGWGLFAEEKIAAGSFIGEYTGLVRKNDEYTLNDYLYEYPVPDPIGRNYVIDATQGNLTRFINHCETPNLKPLYAYSEGIYHLVLVSIQTIKKGSQLTYDYGKKYWYVRTPPLSF